MASNNNEMLIDAQEVDGRIKYRYYKWEKMTNEEGLKVLEDHLERVKNGSCEGRPNVKNKIVPYSSWFYCDDWEDIKSYDDFVKYLKDNNAIGKEIEDPFKQLEDLKKWKEEAKSKGRRLLEQRQELIDAIEKMYLLSYKGELTHSTTKYYMKIAGVMLIEDED